jgi:hypothetical protein
MSLMIIGEIEKKNIYIESKFLELERKINDLQKSKNK